eukprot:747879-Hanusia_phi.AAC.1
MQDRKEEGRWEEEEGWEGKGGGEGKRGKYGREGRWEEEGSIKEEEDPTAQDPPPTFCSPSPPAGAGGCSSCCLLQLGLTSGRLLAGRLTVNFPHEAIRALKIAHGPDLKGRQGRGRGRGE